MNAGEAEIVNKPRFTTGTDVYGTPRWYLWDGGFLLLGRSEGADGLEDQSGVEVPDEIDAQRAREISGGAELTIERDRDKNPVVALREIAEQTVKPKELEESVVVSLQKILPEEEDEADEIGSLSQSAEAMRLSAAAPARSTSVGGDYEG